MPDQPTDRPISSTLAAIDNGSVDAEIGRESREVIRWLTSLAEDVGAAKGELTIKMKFKVERNGTVDVQVESATKLPRKRKERGTFWVGKNGNLSDENPKQQKLFEKVKTVAGEDPVIKN